VHYLSKLAKLFRKFFFKSYRGPKSSFVSLWSNGLQNVKFGGENNIPEFCVFSGDIELGFRSTLGKNNYAIGDVKIGKYCQIGAYVAFHSTSHPTKYLSTYINARLFGGELAKLKTLAPIEIGHDVWIGHGATILSGVKIGSGCIIGAGSVVTKDVPPYSVAVGNPAKILKLRFSPVVVEELLNLNWWDLSDIELEKIKPLFFADLTSVSSVYQIIQDGK
jgi:acetyltransferase-like isoleucine patch superfamily enzyme